MSLPDLTAVLIRTHEAWLGYARSGEGWKSLGSPVDPKKALPESWLKAVSGNVMVVVSDYFGGHAQIVLPNKKELLSDENVAQTLRDQYDLDLSAYALATQQFPVGRDTVQVSVSGIEQAAREGILNWLAPAKPKSLWIMPLAWFVSPLKAVEPALIAIIEDAGHVHVSHHYLGVDDGREIALKELGSYVRSRRSERKDTHLLYHLGRSPEFTKLKGALEKQVSLQPLISKTSSDPWKDLVAEVLDKGEETVAELLHFDWSADLTKSNDKSIKKQADEVVEPTDLPAPVPLPLPPPAPPELPVEPADEVEAAPKKEPKAVVAAKEEVEPEIQEQVEAKVQEVKQEEAVEELVETTATFDSSVPEKVSEPEPEAKENLDQQETKTELLEESPEKPAPKTLEIGSDRYVELPAKPIWPTAILIGVLTMLVVGLVGGGYVWSQQTPAPLPSPTPTPSLLPSPTPEPEASKSADLDASASAALRAKTEVYILNATGVAGLAGRQKALLTSKGWKLIETGNASGQYADADFAYSDNEELIKILEKDLGSELKIMTENKEAAAKGADLLLILGRG